jgi:hypothetical protein
MIRNKLFRSSGSVSCEQACHEVGEWINSTIPPDKVVSIMMEDNEERWDGDVLAVWYCD